MATGNSINDEIREQQRKVLQQEGFKGRFQYFAHYYKWHVVIALLVLLLGGSFIYDVVTQKDIALQVLMVNGFPNIESTEFMADFEQTIALDTKKQETVMDDSFYINSESSTLYDEQNSSKLVVMASSGVVDAVIADKDYFMTMAEEGFLLDLSTILSPEQMALYKDRSFYHDSPHNKAQGEELVGIEITDSPKIVETQSYPNDKAYFCIIVNAPHPDMALTFLEYLDTP